MKTQLNVMWLGLRGFPDVQGGVEAHAEHLCRALVEIGCRVEVIVRSGYQNKGYRTEWEGVHFKLMWAPRMKGVEPVVHTFLGMLYAIWKRPDVLHIQAIGPALFTPLARIFGIRVVVTHHGPDYDRQKWGRFAKWMLEKGERYGMCYSNARIAVSAHIQHLIRDKYGMPSALIPNGVDPPPVCATRQALDNFGLGDARYVLMVGRLVPEKRHLDLIHAFLGAGLDSWKLVLVGASDHPDQYSASVLDVAAVDDRIVCAGFQTGQALRELYAHAGMFVLPSSHEGLPIALLEALSYGLPAIASDIPANREVRSEAVEYFPVGDVERLTQLIRNGAYVRSSNAIRANVRRAVLSRYNWNAAARQTLQLYRLVSWPDSMVSAELSAPASDTAMVLNRMARHGRHGWQSQAAGSDMVQAHHTRPALSGGLRLRSPSSRALASIHAKR